MECVLCISHVSFYAAMLVCIKVRGLSVSLSKDDVKENEGTSCLFILTDPRDPHAVMPFSHSWTLLLTAVPICVSFCLISDSNVQLTHKQAAISIPLREMMSSLGFPYWPELWMLYI